MWHVDYDDIIGGKVNVDCDDDHDDDYDYEDDDDVRFAVWSAKVIFICPPLIHIGIIRTKILAAVKFHNPARFISIESIDVNTGVGLSSCSLTCLDITGKAWTYIIEVALLFPIKDFHET